MPIVYFSQKGARTADGFLTTDTNPPNNVFGRRNLPTQQNLAPGDYIFTCEATDAVDTKFTATVSGGAVATQDGTITGPAGTVATESVDVPFTVPADLGAGSNQAGQNLPQAGGNAT